MKIAFDFDGTLLDSRERHLILLKNILEHLNIRYCSLDDYLNYKADGHSTKDYLMTQLNIDVLLSEEICRIWTERIEDTHFLNYDQLYDDSVLTLADCKNTGHELYLLSARNNRNHFHAQVHTLRLLEYFNQVICIPPENAIQNKSKFIFESEIKFIVGDTEVEFFTAKENHIDCYILNRGFRSKRYWDKHNVKSYDSFLCLGKKLSNLKSLTEQPAPPSNYKGASAVLT